MKHVAKTVAHVDLSDHLVDVVTLTQSISRQENDYFHLGLHPLRQRWRWETEQQGVCQRDEAESHEGSGEAKRHWSQQDSVQHHQMRK